MYVFTFVFLCCFSLKVKPEFIML